MAKAKPEEADEIREEMAGREEELGLEYAAFRHGHIFENVFYGRRFEWSDFYDEGCPETIPKELRLSPLTLQEDVSHLPAPIENE